MKRFLILMLTFALLSCSRDNNVNNCNFLLDVNVSAAINLNLPQFSSLQVTGSVVKLEGQGNAGIILVRRNSDTLIAWDGADPNQPLSSCSPLTIVGINAVSNCGQDIEYNLLTGQSIGQNQQPCTLKAYRVEFVGNNQYFVSN